MANRAYLVANNNSRTAGMSSDGLTYDVDSEIVAAASRLIPILWLSLFAEENLTHHVFEDYRIPTLLESTNDARRRLQSRLILLKDMFPHNVVQIAAFEELLKDVPFDFIKVDAVEIWDFDPDSFESQLTGAVRWFSSAADDDLQHLLDASEVDYDPTTKRLSPVEHPLKHNFHGHAWVREVPWDDTEEDDSEAFEIEPREVTFGKLAKRGIEKHPLVTSLVDIEYFSHAGEEVDFPWATSKGSDFTDAFLAETRDEEWGFVKVSAWSAVMEWVKDNVQSNADEFYREQTDDIDTACDEIFWAKIWPRLPSNLRQREIAFDHFFVPELMNMSIEYDLVARGMPSGLHSLMLKAYENGHFPCGWDGNYPAGKLIIH